MLTILLAFFDAKYQGGFSGLYLATFFLDVFILDIVSTFIKKEK